MSDRNSARESRPVVAVLCILVASLCFVVLDGTGKYLVQTYPVEELVFARFFTTFVLFLAYLGWTHEWRFLRTRRLPAHAVRALLLLLTTASVLGAARHLPLSQVYAIASLSPLLVALLAVSFLGERVSWGIWLCIVAGFLGALVIIRPEVTAPSGPGAWVGLAWSFGMASGIAGYQTMTRVLSATEHPWAQTAYSMGIALVLASIPASAVWVTPDLTGFALMWVMGIAGLFAQIFLVRAFTLAEAAVVAPFNYAQLLWAAIFDLIVFGRLPGFNTWIGALIIVGSGLVILWLRWRAHAR